MTTDVKDELSRLVVKSVSARRAEVTSLLRFAGGLHIVGGRVVVEAELDLGSIARRLRKEIFELYGYTAVVHVLSASGGGGVNDGPGLGRSDDDLGEWRTARGVRTFPQRSAPQCRRR